VVLVVLLEDESHCFFDLVCGVAELVVVVVGLVLHEFAMEGLEGTLALAEGRTRFSRFGGDRSEIAHRLRPEIQLPVRSG